MHCCRTWSGDLTTSCALIVGLKHRSGDTEPVWFLILNTALCIHIEVCRLVSTIVLCSPLLRKRAPTELNLQSPMVREETNKRCYSSRYLLTFP